MNNNDNQSLKSELGAFKNPQIMLVLLITIFGYGGVFASYTYIVPQTEIFAGFPVEAITTFFIYIWDRVLFRNPCSGEAC
ncbi:putative MFS family arabinose efflux permease [Gracilibacillus alcaliphilus]|nr:putative MFS family arabinose efflux permease [Gracilibacillus alcaliphilus]